ncbi:MAG: hypothetical protein MJZ18_01690 [Bacteroidales bacterium]|nr:hypothetical protein [Bacteroidales bacterium]
MLILLDLDGTLINTVHPSWKPFKDGQDNCIIDNYLGQLPLFYGVNEFIQSRKNKHDDLLVVSDSHWKYVNPICSMLGLECVSLADKPNTNKLNEYLDQHPNIKSQIGSGDAVFIGDTKLDIELGRKLGIKTIWFLPYQITEEIKDDRDGIGDEMLARKMGPTYEARSFQDIEVILNSPLENLYSIEAVFAGSNSLKSIKLNYNKYRDGSYACIRCLARQEQGACDKYGCGDKYFMMSNPHRTQDFLHKLANGIASYINQTAIVDQNWDYFTYLTDKQSTVPENKMKEIFDLVNTNIKKVQLLKWADNVQGSLRNRNLYNERQSFLQDYLSVDSPQEDIFDQSGKLIEQLLSLEGKNIIVLDDQLTTAATAWYVIKKLKEKGAKNILFIAMFQMTLAVNSDVFCPMCGKPMLLKIRRSDGHRFYSCTPPQFRGDGCGYTIDISNQ